MWKKNEKRGSVSLAKGVEEKKKKKWRSESATLSNEVGITNALEAKKKPLRAPPVKENDKE
jgi:hypothetical protein